MKRRIQSGMFAAAMAAALGFGGTQAFASPRAADAELACVEGRCNRECRSIGYDEGVCDQGSCVCQFLVPPGS